MKRRTSQLDTMKDKPVEAIVTDAILLLESLAERNWQRPLSKARVRHLAQIHQQLTEDFYGHLRCVDCNRFEHCRQSGIRPYSHPCFGFL